jgi:hypothetical protein
MATPPALACDTHSAQAAAAVTPRMVLPIEFRAMPNLLLRVSRPLHRQENMRVGVTLSLGRGNATAKAKRRTICRYRTTAELAAVDAAGLIFETRLPVWPCLPARSRSSAGGFYAAKGRDDHEKNPAIHEGRRGHWRRGRAGGLKSPRKRN